MKYRIYKWLVGLLLFLPGSFAIGQNVNLNLTTMCPPSNLCNPFLNGSSCGGGVVIRTTHGSPNYYLNPSNGIDLRAAISTSGGFQYGEGLTFAYPFTAGKLYTIKIRHQGTPPPQGASYPQLIAGFVTQPPRNNDGCSLGYLASFNMYASVTLTVSPGETISSFDFQPTVTQSNLWLFANPLTFTETGLLLLGLEIVDHGTAPGGATCYQDANFNFCDPSRVWNGSADVRAVNPITIGCDAFKTSTAPGSGAAFTRRFTAPTITLSPGFVGSATDPSGAVRTLKLIPSATPCTQPLRVASSPISNVRNEAITEQPKLENVNVYPSPSRGLVNIDLNGLELQKAEITVTDQSGRVVYQIRNKSESNLIQLNLQHLSNGIYFIKVNAQNKVAVKKVLISK
jgi:hypothetical protein